MKGAGFAKWGLALAVAWLLLLSAVEFILSAQLGRAVALFMLAAAGCAIGFALRPAYRINFALVVVSLGGSLYLAEIGTSALNRQWTDGVEPAVAAASLRKQGTEAYPTIAPAMHRETDGVQLGSMKLYPLSGIAGKATVFCRESGPLVVYKSDRYGFNNPDEIYARSIQVFLLGDSFTHGACVGQNLDPAGRLRRLGWSVANLGYGGNGPLLELATLREYVAHFRPSVVVWLYYEGNDLQDLEKELQSATLRSYVGTQFSQSLISRQRDVTAILEHALTNLDQFRPRLGRAFGSTIGGVLRLQNLRYLVKTSWSLSAMLLPTEIGYPKADASVLAALTEIVSSAKNAVQSWGGQFHFVYVPDSLRYRAGVDQDRFHQRAEVLSIMRTMDIQVLDFSRTVQALDDPASVYAFLGGHFSEKGYALLAGAIDERLRKQKPH